MLILHGVPWLLFGLVVLVGLILFTLIRCFIPKYLSDYGRGYTNRQHRLAQLLQYCTTIPLVSLVCASWWFLIAVNRGWSEFFRILSGSILSSLNEILMLISDLEFLSAQLTSIEPSVVVPTSAGVIITQVRNIATSIEEATTLGEELLQGLFRMVVAVTYVSMQVILFAAAAGIVAVFLRKGSRLRTAMWFVGLSMVVASLSIGVTTVSTKVIERTTDTLDAFQNKTLTSEQLQIALAQSADAPLVKMFGICEGSLSMDFLDSALDGVAAAWNDFADVSNLTASLRLDYNLARSNFSSAAVVNQSSASPTSNANSSGGTNGTASPFDPFQGNNYTFGNYTVNSTVLRNVTAADIVEYSSVLASQLNNIELVLPFDAKATVAIQSRFNRTSNLMRRILSVTQTALTLVDCDIIRRTLADALPLMRGEILRNGDIALRLMISALAYHLLFILTGITAAHVFSRTRKQFYEARSMRWFRFKACYYAHLRVLETKTPGYFESKHKWKSPISRFSILDRVYTMNLTNAILVALQAVLLLMLHLSSKENELFPILKLVCVFCVSVPLLSFTAEEIHVVPLRAFSRFLASGLSIASIVICVIEAKNRIEFFSDCVVFRQNQASITSAFARNQTSSDAGIVASNEHLVNDCTIDNMTKQIEWIVYSLLVGVACVASAATSLLLLATVWINHTSAPLMENRAWAKGSLERVFWKRVFLVIFLTIITAAITLTCIMVYGGIATANDNVEDHALFRIQTAVGCNGATSMCDRRVDQVLWLASHSSMSSSQDGFFAPNHFYGVKESLAIGVRALNLEIHPSNTTGSSQLQLCNGLCSLGNYSLRRDLTTLRNFLVDNKTQVVMLLIRDRAYNTTLLGQEFEALNMTHLLWTSNTSSTPANNASFVWPTFTRMIQRNRRIMLFFDRPRVTDDDPSWFHYQWDYMFATEERVKTTAAFSCLVTEGDRDGLATSSAKIGLLNHYLSNPTGSPNLAAKANVASEIASRVTQCTSAWTKRVGIVAVDFWSIHNPLWIVNNLNRAFE